MGPPWNATQRTGGGLRRDDRKPRRRVELGDSEGATEAAGRALGCGTDLLRKRPSRPSRIGGCIILKKTLTRVASISSPPAPELISIRSSSCPVIALHNVFHGAGR